VPAWLCNIRVYVKQSLAGAYAGGAYCFFLSVPSLLTIVSRVVSRCPGSKGAIVFYSWNAWRRKKQRKMASH